MESNDDRDRLEKRLERLIRRGKLSSAVEAELEQLNLVIQLEVMEIEVKIRDNSEQGDDNSTN